jgi:MFS family permease
MSSVLAAAAVGGSILGQNLVTRIGPRPVAAASLVVAGLGSTVMSRMTADSGYFETAFWGLTIFGAGLGAGSVAGAIAALSDVAGEDSGVASGLQNATFQIGGAVGIAALSAVAVAHMPGSSPAELVHGYRAAFTACWAFIAVGLLGTALLGKRSADRPQLATEVASHS